ncbi:MAG TPA: proline dehydrogenase family protein [Gaiellaceae bacterium]|nr:proline dehydrogenase family protein [Gaiellaceae bacterium]HXV95135.1 proline dehydrogenase family protein [Gaiellaceae bacterium]
MDAGQAVNGALRKAILASSGSRRVRGFADRHGLRLGASRFVAGEDLNTCVRVLRRLNDQGLHANTTLLGEDVRDEAQTRVVVDEYRAILERLHDEALRCNVALKLTHLGLDLDEELAYENLQRVVTRAGELGNFIRIDMEHSALVDATLRLYRRLREAGHSNVGIVLQSYLYRTPDDLESLLPLAPNLRLVKGAYLEPDSVAYPKKADVDAAYLRLVERSLTGGGYTAIATHDERMIEPALAFAEREGIGRDRFELQMLYGVRPQLQLDLLARGYKVLVATPFGPEWFPFFTRRLAERPANLLFVARNLVRR